MATILIVDDLAANREFLVTLLRYHGHELIEAADGREGLAAVQARRPDLVISDVLMPVMDGYDFVRQLRLDPKTREIPVVFYTAHYGEREARAFALSSGVSYVLTKPAESEEVLKIVGLALAGESETGHRPGVSTLAAEFDRAHLRLLTDTLSEKTGDLRASNARLRALIDVGLELASEPDSAQLLQNVCAAARELFGATYVTLGIVNRQGLTVERFASCGADATDWFKTGDSVAGLLETVVTKGRLVRGENPGGDPAELQLPALHANVQAFLAAPIASSAHVYGWICLVGNEGRSFTEDDEHLVMALAGQLGRVYENGYYYAMAQKRAEELEHEIVAHKRSTDALRTAEERMRFALEAAGVGVWDLDYTTGVHRWSEIVESQYGLEPGTFGGTFEAFVERVHPDDREAVLEAIAKATKSGADFSTEHRSIWPDGTVRWLSGAGRVLLGEHGEPVRAVGITQDVTARRTLEAQYLQAQRMEAIGRLAGGVAHDFNNLLTAILGYSDMLLVDLQPGDPHRADVEEIHRAGTLAAGLTRQLLAFSRKQIIHPTVLDLNDVVSDIRTMLGRLIGDDVKVVLSLGHELARVNADRGQVEQIVMNLAVNARDAMPHGGTLTIATANVELDEDYAATHVDVKPGSYVALTVTDTGTGIAPQVQARLFEPFFTTKEVGKGTGLGLATVHGIVKQNGGSVAVSSELGKGTSFHVYFRRLESS